MSLRNGGDSVGSWPLSTGMSSSDPLVSNFNDMTQNWSCCCGASVPSGCVHHCPTGAGLPRVIVGSSVVIGGIPERRCNRCGEHADVLANYCTRCGKDLRQ